MHFMGAYVCGQTLHKRMHNLLIILYKQCICLILSWSPLFFFISCINNNPSTSSSKMISMMYQFSVPRATIGDHKLSVLQKPKDRNSVSFHYTDQISEVNLSAGSPSIWGGSLASCHVQGLHHSVAYNSIVPIPNVLSSMPFFSILRKNCLPTPYLNKHNRI